MLAKKKRKFQVMLFRLLKSIFILMDLLQMIDLFHFFNVKLHNYTGSFMASFYVKSDHPGADLFMVVQVLLYVCYSLR